MLCKAHVLRIGTGQCPESMGLLMQKWSMIRFLFLFNYQITNTIYQWPISYPELLKDNGA